MDKRASQQRLVLVVSILASFVAFLDGSVVNVGLPAIVRDLGGGLVTQQWVVDAYLITLSSLILVAGSLSDLLGRKRILELGLLGFGVTSVLCAVAPTSGSLIVFRALQGVAGALLVPSSLALIIAVFGSGGSGKAIGTWTAWTGIAYIIGPLLGGFLIDAASWRLIFAINVLPIAATLWLIRRLQHQDVKQRGVRVDMVGAGLSALGLGGSVFALIEQPHYGWSSPIIYAPLVIGVAMLTYFIRYEQRIEQPMLTLELFKVRNFSVGNVATVAIYGGLSVASFLLTVFIQQVGGYSAIEAGLALLPVTIIMFVLSPRFGALCGKYGPRFFMSAGPAVAGLGFFLLLRVHQSVQYWTQLLPGVLLFGLGLSMTVAPLTTAILGSIESRHAGIGSAINNAVARVAGLVAIAAIGVVTGPTLETAGFHRGVVAMAALLLAGGAISAIGIQNSPTVDSGKTANTGPKLQS
jgi:EmrB/QacA subfamily drug resistance transporter